MKRKIRTSKRLVDVMISSFVLVIFSPLILITILFLKVEQIFRGRPLDPLFYSEIRFSLGKEFYLYKFNIFKHELIVEARKNNTFIHTKKLEHGGGLTKVGWLLKQIYMDEIPQFLSVLMGEMSLIGPRPYNAEVHKQALANNLSFRDTVPAGITGSYQSHKETKGAQAHALDKEYVDNYHSQPWPKLMFYDFKIIMKTVGVILRAKGI